MENSNASNAGDNLAFPWSYVPVDFRIPIFSGRQQSPNDPTFLEWKAEVETAFKSWRTPEDHKCGLLFRYLGGEAKREVQVMEGDKSFSGVMARLETIYGDHLRMTTLLSTFFSRNQRDGEGARVYALTLQELALKIKLVTTDHMSDDILRDKFVEGLKNPNLKCEMRKAIRENPKVTFEKIKGECIVMEVERQGPNLKDVEVYFQRRETPQSVKPHTPAPQPTPTRELEDIRSSVRVLEREMAALRQHLEQTSHREHAQGTRQDTRQDTGRHPASNAWPQLPNTPGPWPRKDTRVHGQFRFTEDGSPICWKCQEVGHLGRFCPYGQRRPNENEMYHHLN